MRSSTRPRTRARRSRPDQRRSLYAVPTPATFLSGRGLLRGPFALRYRRRPVDTGAWLLLGESRAHCMTATPAPPPAGDRPTTAAVSEGDEPPHRHHAEADPHGK